MIRYKNTRQIEGIRKSCKLLCEMYRELGPLVQSGVQTIDLDHWAQNWIKKAGGKPAFLGYGPRKCPFPGALCISINNEVIHGIPSKRKLKDGDLVGIDSGIILDGFVSDKTVTYEIGTLSETARKLNAVTRECLELAVAAARAGNRLHAIGKAVESHAKEANFGVVWQFCGHGVGLDIHEDPSISNLPNEGPNPRIRSGMVLALEPMINSGSGEVEVLEDGWTVVTADGSLSSHWEHTIAVFEDHTEVLTAD